VRTVVAMDKPVPALMVENPLSKIPTLVTEDGTILYDSVVIMEYFDSLAGGGKLIPASGPARFIELRRHALATGFLDVLIYWRTERARETPLPSMLHTYETKLNAILPALEAEIDAIAQAPVGIAQITLAVAGDYMDFRFPDLGWRDRAPRFSAWQQRFRERPSMIATPVVDG
jgi:glutathione S-transferase